MRIIEYSSTFKKDFKRENKGKYKKILDKELKVILTRLVNNRSLESKYRNHDLSGNWAGYSECHIKPDLLLIYSKSCTNILRLVRLGSHSNLFN